MFRLPLLIAPATLVFGFASASLVKPEPVFLVNPSPSVPPGLYVRSGEPPAAGRLLAFKVPAPGRAYTARHLPELERGSILKPIVAAEGAIVCVIDGRLRVDGRALGRAARLDRRGDRLPAWTGCRTLREGEYAVYSDRIWNSFDSRYYGPVRQTDILGVYTPLWTPGGRQ